VAYANPLIPFLLIISNLVCLGLVRLADVVVGGWVPVAVLALCCVCSQLVVAMLAELEDMQRFVLLLLLLAKREFVFR
jgi:hypothetical protein